MSSLNDLVQVIPPDVDEEPEDIFASAPGLLFPDDRNQHGDPGSTIVFKSDRFGDLSFTTCDPDNNAERMLFGHYLWNAGLKTAQLLSQEDGPWAVKGEVVLELGAGVGLGGIIAAHAGAQHVVLTDYPAPIVLDNLRRNVARNIPASLACSPTVEGHQWGDLDSAFSAQYAHGFSRILAADCYWMPGEHHNLARSMHHFLSRDPAARVFAIAGFHTGRATLAAFFKIAQEQGLDVEEMYEEDLDGRRRAWVEDSDRVGETKIELKRWLLIARLRRR